MSVGKEKWCDSCFHPLRFDFCLTCHVEDVSCSECPQRFSSFEEFQQHLCQHPYSEELIVECRFVLHDKKKSCRLLFVCAMCSFLFENISKLVTHERTVHKMSKTYWCSYCGAGYSTRFTILNHLRTHERKPLFECTSCDKKFYEKPRLEQHKAVHEFDLTYRCKYCEKPFKSKYVVTRHELQHSTEKFYACPECPKKFLYNFTMKRHQLLHKRRKTTFECAHCGRKYHWKTDLQRHIRSNHQDDKIYVCKICRKSYSRRVYLLEHESSHSNASTYFCVCGKTFRYRSNLARHAKTAHKNLTCNFEVQNSTAS